MTAVDASKPRDDGVSPDAEAGLADQTQSDGGRSRMKPRRRSASFDQRWLPWVTTPILLAVLILAWSIYVRISDISPLVLPAPGKVFSSVGRQLTTGYVWRLYIGPTAVHTLEAVAIGTAAGIFLGFVMGHWRPVEIVVRPFVVALQVAPKIALVPLFILWIGFGGTTKVAMGALIAFFPVLTNTLFGVRSTPSAYKEMLAAFGGSRWAAFRKVEVPWTIPFALAGCEVGIVLAITGVIVAEFLTGGGGLGAYAVQLQNFLQIADLFAAVIIMTGVGLVFYFAVVGLRTLLIPWHESVRSAKASAHGDRDRAVS